MRPTSPAAGRLPCQDLLGDMVSIIDINYIDLLLINRLIVTADNVLFATSLHPGPNVIDLLSNRASTLGYDEKLVINIMLLILLYCNVLKLRGKSRCSMYGNFHVCQCAQSVTQVRQRRLGCANGRTPLFDQMSYQQRKTATRIVFWTCVTTSIICMAAGVARAIIR